MRWLLEVPGEVSGGPFTEDQIVDAICSGLTEANIRASASDGWQELASHPVFQEALRRASICRGSHPSGIVPSVSGDRPADPSAPDVAGETAMAVLRGTGSDSRSD